MAQRPTKSMIQEQNPPQRRMRPHFNSFQPQARPQRQQQNNGYSNHSQRNGYQNPVDSNQFGMMNTQMMNNPMMGHMNNPVPMPNMPIRPQFFNNQQQQQQLHHFGPPNHMNQLLPSLLGNLQFAVANNNLMGHSMPLVQPNYFQPSLQPPAFTSQPQFSYKNAYPPVPTSHQNHQFQPPGFSEPRPQGQFVGIADNTNSSSSKGNDFRNKFTNHQRFKGPGQGFQRSQLHRADNSKGKSGFNKNHMGKGNYNKMATGLDGSGSANIAKEKKRRSYAMMYTSQEIQQWREARRKNFPTKFNVEKRVKRNVSDSILDEEAKMRRQQLREVLAKQAELGVEVAEVPSHYLSNTDEQVNGVRDNNGQFQYNDGKKGRFQNNRHNKRRHGDKDKFSKRPRFEDKNSSQESSMTIRKPTLLEKLLSADIKRDKIQLLQIFRFMVMNSFFKESSEQPLKLPLVMVDETGYEHSSEDPTTDVLWDDHYDDDSSCDEAVD